MEVWDPSGRFGACLTRKELDFKMTTGESSTGVGKPSAGLQLFPPPPNKAKRPGRKPSTRRNAIEPQSPPQSAVERPQSVSYPTNGRYSSLGDRSLPQASSSFSPISQPSQAHIAAAAEIPRSHTSFSEAPTLVRSNSTQSHSSIRKAGLHESPPRGEQPVMRSIFPRYNPEVALEYQNYFPSQASPSHIPKTVINRRPYSPSIHADQRSPGIGGGLQSPLSIGSAAGCFPQHLQDESILEPSTVEELKELWKVANGWRVSASEGRTFCLKMTSLPEEPIHTLSSASSTPFYTLKVIPTSTSAQVSMTRQDPNKPSTNTPRIRSKDKDTDVLTTTLEEPTRRLPPNDGLVAPPLPPRPPPTWPSTWLPNPTAQTVPPS